MQVFWVHTFSTQSVLSVPGGLRIFRAFASLFTLLLLFFVCSFLHFCLFVCLTPVFVCLFVFVTVCHLFTITLLLLVLFVCLFDTCVFCLFVCIFHCSLPVPHHSAPVGFVCLFV